MGIEVEVVKDKRLSDVSWVSTLRSLETVDERGAKSRSHESRRAVVRLRTSITARSSSR